MLRSKTGKASTWMHVMVWLVTEAVLHLESQEAVLSHITVKISSWNGPWWFLIWCSLISRDIYSPGGAWFHCCLVAPGSWILQSWVAFFVWIFSPSLLGSLVSTQLSKHRRWTWKWIHEWVECVCTSILHTLGVVVPVIVKLDKETDLSHFLLFRILLLSLWREVRRKYSLLDR